MIKHLLTAAGLALSLFASAQISHGGQPSNWATKTAPASISFERMGTIDRERLALEDAITDQYKDIPYRFGVEFETHFTLDNSGTLTHNAETGMSTWMLGLECPGALSMSIRFDEFRVPKGGEVFIWSADRKEFLGAFNYKNVKPSGVLACGLIHGDKIVVEYNYPTHLQNRGALTVGQAVHTYRPFASSPFVQDAIEALRGPFGTSGACEVGINCPEAADWQIEKRAVAIITEGGSGLCTGAMVNNTANDGTPYFLTANHCTSGANTTNWVFYFNHEATSCTGNTGSTTDLISGADLIANNAGSDFALLLLSDTPPASYNVQYAGWDASDSEANTTSAVCIHHPGGNVKKFSREDDAPYHSTGNGAQVWWIDNWELAVTEPGSSGSPLFNQDHRIIGQLFGGASACNGTAGNGQYDFYGRFGVSWNTGTTPATRLIDWLDPLGTGALALDGYPDGFTLPNLDAQSGGISNVAENNCSDQITPIFTLFNHGATTLNSCTINYQLNGGATSTIDWSGALNSNLTANINLPTLTAANGTNTLTVWITNVNGNATEDITTNNSTTFTFNAISGNASSFTINLVFDNYPEETSWDIKDNAGNIIASGNSYTGEIVSTDVCVAPGCYDFTIYDQYGDGMCCAYGNGSYEVINPNGVVVATGGTFTDSETTSICTNTVNVKDAVATVVSIYPNPASDCVRVQASGIIRSMRLHDSVGRLVFSQSNTTAQYNLNTTQLTDGIYMLSISTEEGTTNQQLMIRH
jgi:lysyl endopeptidase